MENQQINLQKNETSIQEDLAYLRTRMIAVLKNLEKNSIGATDYDSDKN